MKSGCDRMVMLQIPGIDLLSPTSDSTNAASSQRSPQRRAPVYSPPGIQVHQKMQSPSQLSEHTLAPTDSIQAVLSKSEGQHNLQGGLLGVVTNGLTPYRPTASFSTQANKPYSPPPPARRHLVLGDESKPPDLFPAPVLQAPAASKNSPHQKMNVERSTPIIQAEVAAMPAEAEVTVEQMLGIEQKESSREPSFPLSKAQAQPMKSAAVNGGHSMLGDGSPDSQSSGQGVPATSAAHEFQALFPGSSPEKFSATHSPSSKQESTLTKRKRLFLPTKRAVRKPPRETSHSKFSRPSDLEDADPVTVTPSQSTEKLLPSQSTEKLPSTDIDSNVQEILDSIVNQPAEEAVSVAGETQFQALNGVSAEAVTATPGSTPNMVSENHISSGEDPTEQDTPAGPADDNLRNNAVLELLLGDNGKEELIAEAPQVPEIVDQSSLLQSPGKFSEGAWSTDNSPDKSASPATAVQRPAEKTSSFDDSFSWSPDKPEVLPNAGEPSVDKSTAAEVEAKSGNEAPGSSLLKASYGAGPSQPESSKQHLGTEAGKFDPEWEESKPLELPTPKPFISGKCHCWPPTTPP